MPAVPVYQILFAALQTLLLVNRFLFPVPAVLPAFVLSRFSSYLPLLSSDPAVHLSDLQSAHLASH